MKTDDYYKYPLLEVVQHLASVGKGCEEPNDETEAKLAWLNMRFRSWTKQPYNRNENAFDFAVYELMVAAFRLYEDRFPNLESAVGGW